MKTGLRIAVTLVLCAALLIFVADLQAVMATLRRCDPVWAGIALAALTLDRVLMSYKWGLLLRIRGYMVPLSQRLMIYCSAMMWGLALPSTVGADGIRVLLIRRLGVRVDDTLATILVERGIGFIIALLTAVTGLLILRGIVPDAATYDAWIAFGALGLLGAIAILLFSFSSSALESVLRLLPRRIAQTRVTEILRKLHDAYRSLAGERTLLAGFTVLTLAEHLLLIVCYGLVAVALQVEFNALFLCAAVPLAILISRLPISFDGIGIYEGIFVAIMALGNVAPADALAVSLAARALQIVVWLPWWLMQMATTGSLRPPAQSLPPATS